MMSTANTRAPLRLAAILGTIVAAFSALLARAQEMPKVDTALVVAVDVSDSVDEQRYQLQMEGIAQALEDDSVIQAIIGGSEGGIALTLINWSDRANQSLPWTIIRSKEDALSAARRIRSLPHVRGEFTCLTRMMRIVKETILPEMPVNAVRTVLDVSGDGIDNCAHPDSCKEIRDELAMSRVTINGLPIIVEGENDVVGVGAYRAPGYPRVVGPDTEMTTLDAWYETHVIGGPGAFLLIARGYEDFGRAFRQKFVTEISMRE